MNNNGISYINEIMKKNGLTFHKGLGQNFLYDGEYLDKIVEASELSDSDTVLEIGPGLGVLTSRIAEKAGKVIAVEIDKDIVPVLSEILKDNDNVKIINRDILKTNIKEILPRESNVKVVANLPYYITTPIIMKLLTEQDIFERIVIMVQKEVAQRLTSSCGNKDYGSITVAANYYSDTEYLFTVPRGVFVPSPKVDSAVVRLTLPKKNPVKAKNEKLFFDVVKGAFLQRRKTILNALCSAFDGISKENIRNAITCSGISETVRGECLTVNDFLRLSENIEQYI